MTKWAVVFIVAGLALYLVAGQTQVGWLYLFDAIIWSVLVLSAVLPRYDLKSLRVEQHLLLPAMGYQRLFLNGPLEDESIEIQFKITNSGRLSRYFIKLAADCPFEQPQARRKSFFLVALKHGITTFSYTASCYRRGYYDSSQIILESGGPLGLFARRRKVELPLNLTVYPRYYPMSTSLVAGEEWVERGQGVKASSASEFYGSRNYQYGDPLKHVHWRNTARTGHFMIKEFEQAGQGSLIVAIDTSRDFGEGRETTLEYSVKIAA
ncbi:MAG TPA: DUF58 domain-containing protein, partial [Dehalococcoidales bacterium]|nr:DUF58 domain-containing protein [Dehalococcoidales bacterium]